MGRARLGVVVAVLLEVFAGRAPREFVLPAGRYAVVLSGPASEPTSVGLRVAAVHAQGSG